MKCEFEGEREVTIVPYLRDRKVRYKYEIMWMRQYQGVGYNDM